MRPTARQLVFGEQGEHFAHARGGAPHQLRVMHRRGDGWPQPVLGVGGVEHVGNGGIQPDTHLREPHRVQVALHQLLVCQVDSRWPDLSGHHGRRMAKEVLVVRALGCTVGENQGRLPAATSSAAALCVVRGRGRDVVQIHGVQGGNIHPQLHGRGTDQSRQRSRPLPRLAQLVAVVH